METKNKEKVKQYKQNDYIRHKEEILKKKKEYSEQNKERLQEYRKQYYEQQIKVKRKEEYICGCNSTFSLLYKLQHEKTKKHQAWLHDQENDKAETI